MSKRRKIVITNVDPNGVEAGVGVRVDFTVDGEEYFLEKWATDNSSGEDVYDTKTGRAVEGLFGERSDARFTHMVEVAENAYWETMDALGYQEMCKRANQDAQIAAEAASKWKPPKVKDKDNCPVCGRQMIGRPRACAKHGEPEWQKPEPGDEDAGLESERRARADRGQEGWERSNRPSREAVQGWLAC